MERDMDLVRQILLTLEKRTDTKPLEIEGYTSDQIGFHVWLMADAGLIKGVTVTSQMGLFPNAFPICISWQGYEFLALMKNETTWKKSKATVLDKAGAIGLELVKAVLSAELKKQLGLP